MRRISSQMNNNDTQYRLRQQEIELAKKQAQIGGQNKITSLRDDPVAAGHLVRYESYLNRVNQFEKNAQTVAEQVEVREGYIDSNLQIMQRVRELAVTGANGIYTKEDLKDMSTEVDELLKQLVANANATGVDGKSLFAGTKTDAPAFEVVMGSIPESNEAVITQVKYNGNISSNAVEVDENSYIELNNSGNKTFWAEENILINQKDLSRWTSLEDSEFEIDGFKISVNKGDNIWTVANKINESGANVKATIDQMTGGLSLRTTDSHQIWLEDTKGSTLAGIGMIQGVGHLPPYNIGPNVVSSGASLFDTVIALRDAMLKGDTEAIGSRILGSIDKGMNNLTTRLSKVGSEYEVAMASVQKAETNKLNTTESISREGDVDMTQAVTDMKMLQYVNQATMSTAGKMYSSTLLDYMR